MRPGRRSLLVLLPIVILLVASAWTARHRIVDLYAQLARELASFRR